MITQISASAGSGKTYCLTAFFLSLLEKAAPLPGASGCALHGNVSGYSLAEILAATFTNKAAAEMQSRVVSSLKQKALDELSRTQGASGGQAEIWLERIIRHFGSLNIRTIDSLLTTLVRLSTLELRLPPDFEPSFSADEYFTPFYDSLMEDLAADFPSSSGLPRQPFPEPDEDWFTPPSPSHPTAPDTARQLQFHTADAAFLRARLAEACQGLLYLRDVSGFTLKGKLHDLLLELVDYLLQEKEMPIMDARAIHARLQALHATMCASCKDLAACIREEELSVSKHYQNYLDKCIAVSAYRPLPASAQAHKDSLDDCLNKASKGSASSKAETAFNQALADRTTFSFSQPLLLHALQLAPLISLAREIHSRMTAGQYGSTLLPALRLPLLAGKVLSGENGVSDALCRLGSRLSRVLLDEFQDTSRDQWAAILPLAVESLSTGGELTYVGDVKQAIYGWRGGDARLFDEALQEPELTAVAPNPRIEHLPYNWRSHPAIVHHNNAFFSLISDPALARELLSAMLPKGTPERYRAQAGAEAARIFSRVSQAVPPEKNWQEDPKSGLARVRLYGVDADTVSQVTELVRRRLRVLFLEELCPVWKYGDIAVLVSSGSEAALVAEWLTEWGLPVVTENSFLLSAHPLVGRLISFLTFLDYPLGDLAFSEFLAGPECLGCDPAFDPAAFPDWLARISRLHGKDRPPLYQLFRQDFPDLWEAYVAPFYTEAGLMSAYDTLLEAVKRFQLPQRLPEQLPFIRRLLEVAHLAESKGHSSLAAFLSFWQTCGDSEKLPLPEHMDAVRIMTIHKAKGLEFPVVVLPFQHRGLRRPPGLTAATLHGMRLLTRAEPELEDIYYPGCITDELERLNLLYVAWTRPVYALHAFITRPRTSTPLTNALDILLAAYLEQGGAELCQLENVSEELDAIDATDSELGDTLLPTRPGSTSTTDLSSPLPVYSREEQAVLPVRQEATQPAAKRWRPMDWLPRLKIYRSALPETAFTPRQRGILTHLCLEHLRLSGESPDVLAPDVSRAVRQALRLFPLPLENPAGVAAEMESALLWFASLPQTPFWLLHGLREQGIMDTHGHMHRVDLLVDMREADSSGSAPLLAVDYKTGSSGGHEASREDHRQQVRRYMRLMSEATGRRVQGVLVYLDKRRLVSVEEA